jgi:hypothetical protein
MTSQRASLGHRVESVRVLAAELGLPFASHFAPELLTTLQANLYFYSALTLSFEKSCDCGSYGIFRGLLLPRSSHPQLDAHNVVGRLATRTMRASVTPIGCSGH